MMNEYGSRVGLLSHASKITKSYSGGRIKQIKHIMAGVVVPVHFISEQGHTFHLFTLLIHSALSALRLGTYCNTVLYTHSLAAV